MSGLSSALIAQIQDLIANSKASQERFDDWLGGTVGGGPNEDGRYPLIDRLNNEILVPCPALLADMVTGPAAVATTARDLAQTFANAASQSATLAANDRSLAEAAKNASIAGRDMAQTHRSFAATHEANAQYWAELAQSLGGNVTVEAGTVQLLHDAVVANAAAAADSATAAAASAAEAATFDPDLFDLKTDPLAAARLTGMIDPARIPVLVGQIPIVSSGGIADLTSGQQSSIAAGTLVATTDGKRWVYRDETGSLSKTSEASYIEQGDVTPDYSVIANKPLNYQSNIAMVSGLQSALDGKSATEHGHVIADVSGLQTALDGKSGTGHGHAVADVTGLQSALDAKSAIGHGHAISDVSGLQSALDGKSATGHGHAISDVSGLQSALDAKLASSGYTASDVLAKVITVDGTGSGLDADTVDGVQASGFIQTAPAAPQNIDDYALYLKNGRAISMGYSGGNYGAIGYNVGFTTTSNVFTAQSSDTTSKITFDSGGITVEGAGSGEAGRTVSFTSLLTVPLSGNMLHKGATVWTAANDGAGSGLDADLLDGLHASSFGQVGSTNSWAGTQIFVSGNALSLRNDSAYIDWYNSAQTSRRAYVQHTGVAWTFVNEVSAAPINFNTTGGGTVQVNGSLVWHAGNDGAGSGLDADLLDGLNTGTASSGSTIVARNGSGYIDSHSLTVVSGAGNGLRLWDGSTAYSIYMSDAGNPSWGLRPTTETTSDYNMYFQMAGGGANRGWVFRNNGSVVGGLDGGGNLRNSGFTKSKNGLVDYGGNLGSTLSCRYALPGGASYQSQTSSVTGAIKIRLPRKGSSAMMKMRVEVFNYATGTSKSFTISAYPYNGGGGVTNWVNITAEQYGETSAALNVRFGYDGTYDCIWIGETSTVWQYPQVFVTNFMHGYSGHSDEWTNNWAVTMETAFDTVSAGPRSCAVFWNTHNDGAGSGLDADTVDGYNTDTTSGSAAGIPVRDSNGYLNQRVISNLSGGTSDGMYIGLAAAGGTGSITRIYGGGSGNACLRVYSNYLAWFDGSTEARLWYDGNVPTNTWLRDQGGTNRFNFAAGSTTYFGSAGGYNFRNSANADAAVLSNGGAFSCIGDITAYSSDARLKENARPIVDPLGKIDQINGYTFDWRRELVDELGFTPHQYEDEHGFLAQEIETVVPDAVRPAPFNDEYLTVKYERIVPLAIAGIKALKQEIEDLKAILKSKGLL